MLWHAVFASVVVLIQYIMLHRINFTTRDSLGLDREHQCGVEAVLSAEVVVVVLSVLPELDTL
jgi:hypothetical protein